MKTLTMVARYGRKEEKFDIAYLLVDENYRLVRAEPKDIRNMLMNGVVITNIGMEDGKIVSTNGALDKYTRIDVQNMGFIGEPSPVILNRVEKGDDLIGYTIYNIDGTLREMSVRDAVTLHKRTPFANGKLRDTQSGEIISSINGKYPLRTISVKKASEKRWEITMQVTYAATAIKGEKGVDHAGVMLNFDSAADYTKIHQAIETERVKLLEDLIHCGVRDLDAYKTLRFKSGFYTTVPLRVLDILLKKGGAKLANKNVATVSAIEFDGEEFTESVLKIGENVRVDKAIKVREDLDAEALKLHGKLVAILN